MSLEFGQDSKAVDRNEKVYKHVFKFHISTWFIVFLENQFFYRRGLWYTDCMPC